MGPSEPSGTIWEMVVCPDLNEKVKSLQEVKSEELTSPGLLFIVLRGVNEFCCLMLTHPEYQGVVFKVKALN